MCFCLAHAGPLCRLCHHDLNDQPSAEFHKQNDHEDKRRKNTPNRITSYTPAPEPQEARAVWGGGGQWRLSVGSVPVHLDLLRLIHPTPSFLPFPITSQVSAPSVPWPAARVVGSRQPSPVPVGVGAFYQLTPLTRLSVSRAGTEDVHFLFHGETS